MDKQECISVLKDLADSSAVPFMAKYGINPVHALGIKIPVLRNLARSIGKNHDLAISLWEEKYHEGRILASMIADPKKASPELMDRWIGDFNSWDLCDQVCMNLFEKTDFAWSKAAEWCKREAEFERRAGFVMIARLAVSDKKAPGSLFEALIPKLEAGAEDHRNFVKKAVNWAIRQTGKRNLFLNGKMISLCERLLEKDSKSARWVAADAHRELSEKRIQARLIKKANLIL